MSMTMAPQIPEAGNVIITNRELVLEALLQLRQMFLHMLVMDKLNVKKKIPFLLKHKMDILRESACH